MCWAAVMYYPRQALSWSMRLSPSERGSHRTVCLDWSYRQKYVSFDADPVSPPVCSKEGDLSSISADALATALGRGQDHPVSTATAEAETSTGDYVCRPGAMLPLLAFAAFPSSGYL